MKKILIYFLFVGLFNLSFLQKIQTKESVKINSPFLGCLDQKQKDHLIKLHSSFSHFIEKNYAASKKVFLNEVLNGELKKDIVFKSEDNSLIKQLRKDTFLNIAFKRVTAETRFSYLEKEEKRKAIEKNKDYEFWDFDNSKKYLKCLNKLEVKDSLTIDYLKIKNVVPDISTQMIAGYLLDSLKKNNEEGDLIDYIIIVEIYYLILNQKYLEGKL